jgi:homogentisate 1,2-dioxygenase
LGLSQKTHTFEKPDGGFITNNFGTEGFHGNSALLYHVDLQVKEIIKSYSVEPKIAIGKKHLTFC